MGSRCCVLLSNWVLLVVVDFREVDFMGRIFFCADWNLVNGGWAIDNSARFGDCFWFVLLVVVCGDEVKT